MAEPPTEQHQIKIDYETAHFLQSLFAHDHSLLKYLDEKLGVRSVTRDGWIIFQGSEAACARARRVMDDLEESRRSGGAIEPRDFRMAVDLVANDEAGGVGVLRRVQLRGGKGRGPVVARSPHQLEYLETMQSHEVVFGLGPAGTGKTFLAVAMALNELLEKRVSRVILARPAVEAGEALGFLPGDLSDKVGPYLRPLFDAIAEVVGFEMGQRYMEEGVIEIAPLAYMRGRTLSRSFVILDEAQNTTPEQMFMALTRLGEGSRMVVTGDLTQVDLKRGQQSGLEEAVAALKGIAQIGFTRFTEGDVVRHPVVARILRAYQSYRDDAAH